MKIALFPLKLILLLITYSYTNSLLANNNIVNCEDDFVKPTIEFPNFPGLACGDTMFLICASDLLGAIQEEGTVLDNCDPDPLIKFTDYCTAEADCSLGYMYFTVNDWTIVDNNNNVTECTIYAAIGDKRPPIINLNLGKEIRYGDTINMECGFGAVFDESSITVEDECDPSTFCDATKSNVDVFFQERIIAQGDCSDYLTKMFCKWTATDACGNQSFFEVVVFLTDNTAPEFVNVPDHFCGSTSLTTQEFADYERQLSDIEVEDRCSNVEVIHTVSDLSDGCDYFIQWEATDACGNKSYHEQHVCIVNARCSGKISGTVLLDLDQDRFGDEAIPGVDLLLVEDINGNGIVDGGEQVYATTTTDENGFYNFRDVPQGCYVIVELQPTGFIDSKDRDVTNPGNLDQDGQEDEVDNLIPVCITPGEFDDGNDFVEQQVILDILLSEFNGEFNEEENSVLINWKTEYEINFDYFVLERSVDGDHYQALNSLEANGHQTKSKKYSYIDNSLTNSQRHFYRLAEVDLDGTKTYSEIISIRTPSSTHSLVVYPNPTSGMININVGTSDVDEKVHLKIYDILGDLRYSQKHTDKLLQLNLNGLGKGTYFISVQSGSFHHVEKIFLAS